MHLPNFDSSSYKIYYNYLTFQHYRIYLQFFEKETNAIDPMQQIFEH